MFYLVSFHSYRTSCILAHYGGLELYGQIRYNQYMERFLMRTALIGNEGLLVDFLQKATCDIGIRKFLIYASYLFNERLVFDHLIRFSLDFIIGPLHYLNSFEYLNFMWVLNSLIGLLLGLILSFFFFYGLVW